MSSMKLVYRFGGYWDMLDYVGGDDKLVTISQNESIYDLVLKHAYYSCNVDMNNARCVLHALVHEEGLGIRKKKLKSDNDVYNLFAQGHIPVIFVTEKWHTYDSKRYDSNINYSTGGSSSYAANQDHILDDHVHMESSNIGIESDDVGVDTDGSMESYEEYEKAETENHNIEETTQWKIPRPHDIVSKDQKIGEDTEMSNDSISVGSIYYCKESLNIAIGLYHVDRFGEYKIRYSDHKRLKAICKMKSCPFTISASGAESVWRVYKVIDHTCMIDPHRSGPRRLPSKILGAHFAPRLYKEKSSLVPRVMISELQQRNSIHVSYDIALKAKHHAIRMTYGDQKKSFARLPTYLHVLKERNPGSFTALEIDKVDHKFRNVFFALNASITGFCKYGRPVIVIDGTHLKGIYNGILFVAVSQDSNKQIFPLGFGVGHIEDDATWIWFLHNLRAAYGCKKDLVIVSDAHKSISNAVKLVFPEANHCLCYYHLQNNMKAAGKIVCELFQQAAYAYRTEDYELAMQKIHTLNSRIAEELVRKGPHKWARSQCSARRYEFMTSNAAESFNNRVRRARTLPITSVLEVIRSILEKWFYDRRTEAKNRSDLVTENISSDIGKMVVKSLPMEVQRIEHRKFKVIDGMRLFNVDLTARKCTCGFFDEMLIPCTHAIAATRLLNHNVFSYVDQCYYTNNLVGMWSGIIYPVPEPACWAVPVDVKNIICLPPNKQRQAGRPRGSRFQAGPSKTYFKKSQSCGRCRLTGHNTVSCHQYIPDNENVDAGNKDKNQSTKQRAKKKCSICSSTEHTKRKCLNYVAATNLGDD